MAYRQAAQAVAGRPARRDRGAGGERTVLGVPERFMRPRIVLALCVGILVAFGVLMVYSASSVTALADTGDAAYYLKRELMFLAVGLVAALALAVLDYHIWVQRFLVPIWIVTALLLALVIVAGTDNDMGATRWINLGFFDLQPSEFAKITIVFTAANLAESYFERGTLDWWGFLKLLAAGVGLPLLLIIIQPDKGSTLVLGLTIIVMGYLAGVPRAYLGIVLFLGVAAFLALSLKDDYSRQRLLTMLDPESDPFGSGYQILQGFYAFGSGGLFGVGLGFSRQKYSYLPMAHNDFIFAVIGEECGLVGTLGVLAGFAVFLWAGLQIARYAPDLSGRLLAAGCTSLVVIQMLLNVSGVLGIFPLSGKPIPFISYGGSSIIASLMLVGLILSVSIHSRLPETSHDGMRRSWQVAPGEPGGYDAGLSFVGEPVARSQRPRRDDAVGRRAGSGGPAGSRGGARGGLTVMEGGSGRSGRGSSGRGAPGRGTTGRGQRGRIDLGPSASERLRDRRGGPRGRR